jgi:hypothetical protein
MNERAQVRGEKFLVYERETGEAISYHRSEALADKAARRIDAALRRVTIKRIAQEGN